MIDRPIALAAPGLVIAGQRRNSLQQRGFAGAVLADNDGDGTVEIELETVAEEGKTEWIGFAVGNGRRVKPEPLQIGRRQIRVTSLSRTHDPVAPPPGWKDAPL